MPLDINGGELLIIVVLALVLIGPERLPQYAAQLARVVRRLKSFATDARERVSEELGPELGDVEWSKLDPRQYDPRRIVRDALLDDDAARPAASAGAAAAGTAPAAAAVRRPAPRPVLAGPAPFDPDAT